jgi:hypothetical protein
VAKATMSGTPRSVRANDSIATFNRIQDGRRATAILTSSDQSILNPYQLEGVEAAELVHAVNELLPAVSGDESGRQRVDFLNFALPAIQQLQISRSKLPVPGKREGGDERIGSLNVPLKRKNSRRSGTGLDPKRVLAAAKKRTPQAARDARASVLTAPGTSVREAINVLRSVSDGARRLASAWDALAADPSLSLSVENHLSGFLAIKPLPAFAGDKIRSAGADRPFATWMTEKRDFKERIQQSLSEDLSRLANEVDELVHVLAANSAKKPAEYLCVWAIALGWYSVTGTLPTFTNNREAVSGPQTTAFQRLLKAIVPAPPISAKIVRNVLKAMREFPQLLKPTANLSAYNFPPDMIFAPAITATSSVDAVEETRSIQPKKPMQGRARRGTV